jgi:cell division protein FtsN
VTSEDHDSRISELYRQSSQETPPAHIDRAVQEMARKSVRRRLLLPFGNHWVAGGALAGVVVLSVLLITDVPLQPDHYAPEQDAVAPARETLSKMREETAQRRALTAEQPAAPAMQRDAPVAARPRFDFYGALPDSEVAVPKAESRARLQQAPPAVADEATGTTATAPPAAAEETAGKAATVPAAPAAEPAGTKTAPAGTRYLQVGSFREKNSAVRFKARLMKLGYRCEIHEASIDDTGVYYRVRVGPFTDNDALNNTKQKLGESGIGAYAVRVGE